MEPVIAMPWVKKDLLRAYMLRKYVSSLRRSGARVCRICLDDPDLAVRQMLECDGLLLPGGEDIAPWRYGQEPIARCGTPDEHRDQGEWALLEAFVPTGKPILGICRGIQMLNVFFGGTLHQDIVPTQSCRHIQWLGKDTGSHKVTLIRGTKLEKLLGKERIRVNSLHHQAADHVAPGLTVSAVSEDGFIEGVEAPDHPFCVGVQWHPEHMSRYFPGQQRIFDGFVEACRQYHSKR